LENLVGLLGQGGFGRGSGVVNETSTTKRLRFGAESLTWRIDLRVIERRFVLRLTLIGKPCGTSLNGIT
jgi:hypothetical protein